MLKRRVHSRCALLLSVSLVLLLSACSVNTKKDGGSGDESIDIKMPALGVHIGKDVDAHDTGLTVYPGARKVEKKGDNEENANLNIATSAFGLKVVAVQFESDDSPSKIIDFYKDQLKQYGNVLECHTRDQGGNVDIHEGKHDPDQKKSKQLTCDENEGPVIELKAGTEDNQHLVSVKTNGAGAKFSLVHVKIRGDETI